MDPLLDASIRQRAETLDQEDALRHTRDEFVIPTKQEITSKTLAKKGQQLRASFYFIRRHLAPFILSLPQLIHMLLLALNASRL